ncbi:MAG TPA: hypothetical protein VE309_00315 [Caulobacteraceae bacterium]|nr:hypothetical protein [Caulobacteraceae bacterium]
MSDALFTTIHVIISLIAILAGLVVVIGMPRNRHSGPWAAIYLVLIAFTSLTGYPIPPLGFDPPRLIGTISLVLIIMAVAALYVFHLGGVWRAIYVVTATAALYFNCFVGVVQAYGKVPFMHALAPTQSSPLFAVTQLAVLVIFIALGYLGVKRFRPTAV